MKPGNKARQSAQGKGTNGREQRGLLSWEGEEMVIKALGGN